MALGLFIHSFKSHYFISLVGEHMFMWRTEQLRELVVSFHHLGPGDQSQVIRVGSMSLYLLGHFVAPI